jgi:uncharacterized membrane protein YfcA
MLYFLLAFVGSLFASAFGLSIGCIITPILLFAGLSYATAVDATLAAIFFTSLTGLLQNKRQIKVAVEPVWLIAISGSITALIGDYFIRQHVPDIYLKLIYAVFMFLSVDILKYLKKKNSYAETNKNNIDYKSYFFSYIFAGAISGLSASLLSVGATFIIVPYLMLFNNYGLKLAVKTTMITMIPISFFSLTYEIFTNTLNYSVASIVACGAILGTFLGLVVLRYIDTLVILRVNIYIYFVVGFSMIIQILISLV